MGGSGSGQLSSARVRQLASFTVSISCFKSKRIPIFNSPIRAISFGSCQWASCLNAVMLDEIGFRTASMVCCSLL